MGGDARLNDYDCGYSSNQAFPHPQPLSHGAGEGCSSRGSAVMRRPIGALYATGYGIDVHLVVLP